MKHLILFITTLSLFACGGSSKEGVMDRDERLSGIRELEDDAFSDIERFDTTTALALIRQYEQFSIENPDDELTPSFLFKAGDLSMGMKKAHRAVSFFDQIIDNYPEYDKAPYSMFLKAFIYEDQLKDFDKAREGYEDFIEKYPDHDMAEAAAFSIMNLGKSPEELIREFELKNDTMPARI